MYANASEQMLSEITSILYDIDPNLDTTQAKNKLSSIFTKYHVNKVNFEETHPDLSEKIDMFLSAKKLEGLSELTLLGYELDLKIFAARVKKKVENINSIDIRNYLSNLNGLKMSTIGKKLTVLKSFFSWLVSEEIVQRDPTMKIKAPKTEKRMPKALTIEELEMLRESCLTLRERVLLECLYATGARLGEIHKLNKNEINFQNMSCKVIGKGNKERQVYFSFRAMYYLRKYLNSRNDDCEALLVTERKPYRRLSRRSIQQEIKNIASRIGLQDKVTPHVLRHTFATLTLSNGCELTVIQELLGHSSPETTLRYVKVTEERKREMHRKYLIQ